MQNIQLKSTLRTLYEYADLIEKKGQYNRIGKIGLKEYLRFDLLKFLLWLSDGGDLTNDEISFLNDVLEFKYTKNDLVNFYNNLKISSTFSNKIPDSFEVFVHYENQNQGTGSMASILADFYRVLGNEFITADHVSTNSEVSKLIEFIVFLRDGSSSKEGKARVPAKMSENGEDGQVTSTRSYDEVISELDALVGLEAVKRDVHSLINLIRVRKMREERGLKQPVLSLHLVFTGNPGTGKTTVARLLGELYHAIGLLSKGHLVETDRSGLIEGYIGGTAIKVSKVVEKSLGGILFIDEAYALYNIFAPNDFGGEAIATLLKLMEDNREDLIVICAGYTDLMNDFLNSNPGLRSRFNKYIEFDDYDVEELLKILELNCVKMQMVMTNDAKACAKVFFEKRVLTKEENFANGRDVRNYFEKALTNQANRIADLKEVSNETLNTITLDDVENIVI
jgi:AAA+ superfamily predicted ATPase